MSENFTDGDINDQDILELPDEIDLDEPWEGPQDQEEGKYEEQGAEEESQNNSETEQYAQEEEYNSQSVTSIPPEMFTEEEREALEELMVTDPVRANIVLTQRIIQREMASNAILNQTLAPIAAKAPKLVNAYGAQVQQAASLLTAEAKSNPKQAEAMTWGMVISNEIAQHGVVEAVRRISRLIDTEQDAQHVHQAKQQAKQQPQRNRIAPEQRVATGIQTKSGPPQQTYTRRQAANNAMAEILGVDPTIVAGI